MCVAHTSPHSAATVRDIEKSLIAANMQWKTGFPVQPTDKSTVGPTLRPTVRSILKLCKCAITFVRILPVITGKTVWNWWHAVLSADAGILIILKHYIWSLY